MEERIKKLIDFCQIIHRKEAGKETYQEYLNDLESITPQEVMLVQYEQLKMGLTPKEMLEFVDKLMNVFHKPLSQYRWNRPKEGTFLFHLMEENKGLTLRLEAFKAIVKQGLLNGNRDKTSAFINDTLAYNEHLIKLENILFPYLEKRMERFNGLKIMWSLHDEVRQLWKVLMAQVQSQETAEREISRAIGQLYFHLYGLVEKQELILFPAASELLAEDVFADMLKQSFEYSFPFITKPEPPENTTPISTSNYDALRSLIVTETGHFDLEQLSLIMSVLPLDLTLVDENDQVAYFTKPKDRVFPRSAAIIGRDVRNCHPPESVHVVEAILASFKNGEKDEAKFWIRMKGLFIYIRYIALRDSHGRYRGTLEITQEISELRALEGERRLLNW